MSSGSCGFACVIEYETSVVVRAETLASIESCVVVVSVFLRVMHVVTLFCRV